MSLDDEIIFMRMISEYFHDEEKLCQPFKHKAKRNFIILLAKKKGNFMKGNFVWFLSSDASRVLVACYAPLFFLFLMPWILWSWENFSDFLHSWMTGRILLFPKNFCIGIAMQRDEIESECLWKFVENKFQARKILVGFSASPDK